MKNTINGMVIRAGDNIGIGDNAYLVTASSSKDDVLGRMMVENGRTVSELMVSRLDLTLRGWYFLSIAEAVDISIGQLIINEELLSADQARTVVRDLRLLDEKGIEPDWAEEVAARLEVSKSSLPVQVMAWRAAARVLILCTK